MNIHMTSQISGGREGLRTHVAFMWLLLEKQVDVLYDHVHEFKNITKKNHKYGLVCI